MKIEVIFLVLRHVCGNKIGICRAILGPLALFAQGFSVAFANYIRRCLLFFFFVFFLLVPKKSLGSGDLCINLYDPSYFTALLAKENLGHLARLDGEWFEVAIPESTQAGVIFRFKEVKSWSEVVTSFEGISLMERQITQKKLMDYAKSFNQISTFFRTIAKTRNATMTARLKDLGSLKNKIIDHAKKQATDGQNYSLSSVDDFLGVRLMLPWNSDLLSPHRSHREPSQDDLINYYSERLGVTKETIQKVEIKGGPSDQAKGKFYRSIHVTLSLSDGLPIELQLMSKSMSIWHSWDHPKVYKAKNQNPFYLIQLKNYSLFWARMIRALEDSVRTGEELKEPKAVLDDYGLGDALPMKPSGSMFEWLQSLDERVSKKLGISIEDRLLSIKSILPLSRKRQLSFELSAQP